MALLKSLNEQCRKDVQLQLQTYRLRRVEVAENQALLKQKAKAELTRPGTLAAVFTLGVLAAPGGKGKDKRRDDAERAARSERRAAAAADRATEAKQDAEATGAKQKDKAFDPLDIFFSVLSSVAVRLVSNWVTGKASTPPQPMPDADVDTSTSVEL